MVELQAGLAARLTAAAERQQWCGRGVCVLLLRGQRRAWLMA